VYVGIELVLDMAAASYDDRLATGTRADGLSYAELDRLASGGAALVRAAGAGSVAFLGVNGPALPALMFAAARAGVPICPLNYRLTAGQLADLLEQLDGPYVVVGRQHLDLVPGRTIHLVDEWLAAARQQAPVEGEPAADEDAAVILFTSGTTAAPKAALLRHQNLISYVLQTVEFESAADDDAILISVPPYHVAGVGAALTNVYAGRRMVYLPDFSPQGWLELVRREGITNAMVVPTMLARIVEHLAGAPAQTPSLRTLAYGGARMPSAVLEAALAAFPNVDFVNAYGLTETSSTIAVLGPEDHRLAHASDDPFVRARLGSIGRFVPGIEAQIRDESGQEVAQGEFGELWVRGPQVCGDYRGRGSVVDAEGWFPTRDLARIDEEGYVFLNGRVDDTIIRGGENIAPQEVEEVLVDFPGIRDAAVVGVPDDEWGQRLVAVLVAEDERRLDPREVSSFVRQRLRGSRTPDDIVLRTELPYSATGKLLRRVLISELTGSSN
jgi:acyl-CoA synthetase (AMP-forming)/AMP-acid ligase II